MTATPRTPPKAEATPLSCVRFRRFGFNAILGLIGLAGIIMRNSLILIGQIHTNEHEGLDPFHAVVEAIVQRARPVILTALAAILAFIPLTFSVFWFSMAYTLIGETILTLVFLPALYAIWFRIRDPRATPVQPAIRGWRLDRQAWRSRASETPAPPSPEGKTGRDAFRKKP